VQFDNNDDDESIKGWFCTCSAGARVIGCCAHITALANTQTVKEVMMKTIVRAKATAAITSLFCFSLLSLFYYILIIFNLSNIFSAHEF
jgi:hypothetical protein